VNFKLPYQVSPRAQLQNQTAMNDILSMIGEMLGPSVFANLHNDNSDNNDSAAAHAVRKDGVAKLHKDNSDNSDSTAAHAEHKDKVELRPPSPFFLEDLMASLHSSPPRLLEERMVSGIILRTSSLPPPLQYSTRPPSTPTFSTANLPRRVRWADQEVLGQTRGNQIPTRVDFRKLVAAQHVPKRVDFQDPVAAQHVQRARLAASRASEFNRASSL